MEGDPTVTPDIGLMVLPISFYCQTLSNPIGAFLQRRLNPKIILTIGSTIMLSSMLAASYCTTWNTFVIFYAFCFPFGIGINYYTPIVCGWEWFP